MMDRNNWGIRNRNGYHLSEKYTAGNRNVKGFTLVELIVVLVIIAILAAIAVPTFIAFIDRGREKKREANAQMALTSAQTILSDLYADASNTLKPELRNKALQLSGVEDGTDSQGNSLANTTRLIIWTEKPLQDGYTTPNQENIGSYTIAKALYSEEPDGNGGYVYNYVFNGNNWVPYEGDEGKALADLGSSQINDRVIYMWPYQFDFAYNRSRQPGEDDEYEEDAEGASSIKTVRLQLNDNLKDYFYFARPGINENSELDYIDVLFWKTGNGDDDYDSYWIQPGEKNNTYGYDIYQVDYYYSYRTVEYADPSDPDNKCTFEGWYDSATGDQGRKFSTRKQIADYIFKEEQNKDKAQFTFVAKVTVPVTANTVTISSIKFASVFSQGVVSDVKRIPSDSMDRSSALQKANRVQIDDLKTLGAEAYAWYENGEVHWWTNAETAFMEESWDGFLSGNTNVRKFSFDGLNMSKVTTMHAMFKDCTALTEISFDTANSNAGNLTNVSEMLSGCTALSNLNGFSSLKTGSLKTVNGMFYNCGIQSNEQNGPSLNIVFGPDFNTSAVSDFSGMFSSCHAGSIDASSINVSNAVNLNEMFKDCNKLTSLDLRNWDVGKVDTMNSTFEGCASLSNIMIADLDFSSVSSMNNTFRNCSSLDNLSAVKTSDKLKTISGMFDGCSKLSEIDVSKMNTNNVSNMSSLFENCEKLTTITGIDAFCTKNATDMSNMFKNTNSLAELNLTSFNTEKVTKFNGMFAYDRDNSTLKKIYASPKFVVKEMHRNQDMFSRDNALVGSRGTAYSQAANPTKANYACIDGWNGQKGYFYLLNKVYVDKQKLGALIGGVSIKKIEKIPTEALNLDWARTNGTDIKDTSAGFDCEGYHLYAWTSKDGTLRWWTDADLVFMHGNYNGLFTIGNGASRKSLQNFDFYGFDVSEVTSFEGMFKDCTNLETVGFGSMFYAESATSVREMFSGCSKLKNIDLQNLKASTGTITNTANMFYGCKELPSVEFGDEFNGSGIENTSKMFQGCTALQTANLSKFGNMQNVQNISFMFADCTNLGNGGNGVVFGENGWNLKSCTNIESAFNGCVGLKQDLHEIAIPADNNDLKVLINVFKNCSSLETLDLSHWNLQGLTRIDSIFWGCTKMSTVTMNGGSFANNAATIANVFTDCGKNSQNGLIIKLNGWDFKSNANLKNLLITAKGNVTGIEIKACKDTEGNILLDVFKDFTKLETVDLSGWENPNSVTGLESTFCNCKELRTITFTEGWNGKSITSLFNAFSGCEKLDFSFMGTFKPDAIVSIRSAFENCTGLETLDLSSWNTENLESTLGAFRGCTNLKELYLNGWKITKAKGNSGSVHSEIFVGCINLERIYVTSDFRMYSGAMNVNVFGNNDKLVANSTRYADKKTENPQNYNKGIYAWPDEITRTDGYNGNSPDGYLTCVKKTAMFIPMNDGDWVETVKKKIDGSTASKTEITKIVRSTIPFENIPAESKRTEIQDKTYTPVNPKIEELVEVYAWVDNGTLYWWSEADCVYINPVTEGMFKGLTEATSISMTGMDSSKLPSTKEMFAGCNKLTSIDGLDSLETENITDMSGMFEGCEKLTSIDVSGLNTKNVTDMSGMFEGCKKLTSIDVSGFDTKNVSDMSSMFKGCSELTNIDLANFDSSELLNSSRMFDGATMLASVVLGESFACEKVTDMSSMFAGCSGLGKLDFGYFNTNALIATDNMFNGCNSLQKILAKDPSDPLSEGRGFKNAGITSSENMFLGCSVLKGGMGFSVSGNTAADKYSAGWAVVNTANSDGYFTDKNAIGMAKIKPISNNWTNFSGASAFLNNPTSNAVVKSFQKAEYMTEAQKSAAKKVGICTEEYPEEVYMWIDGDKNIYWWSDATDVFIDENTKYMFNGWKVVETLDLRGLNFGLVTDFTQFFCDCKVLTSLNLEGFNTSSATNMLMMFSSCECIETLDLSSFNTENVTNMQDMFQWCKAVKSINLSSFNTQNVVTMKRMFGMGSDTVFSGENKVLDKLDLSSFTTDSLQDVSNMFLRMRELDTIIVKEGEWNGWLEKDGTNKYGSHANGKGRGDNMFKGCNDLYGPVTNVHPSNINGNGKDLSAEYAYIDSTAHKGYFTAAQ